MKAIELIIEERARQIDKGYSLDHDYSHRPGEIAMAAASYAAPVPIFTVAFCGDGDAHQIWPWDSEEVGERMEEKGELERLIIAGALIVAEIECYLRRRDEGSAKV